MTKRTLALLLALAAGAAGHAADPAPFDLTGPGLRVTVARGGTTLPIGEVPNLAEGDRLTIVPDMPADQSAHYLLVAAFLRGATNPPPESWFTQAETWMIKGARGLALTVPKGAQQVVLFLAPSTGGDFSTLKNTVRGKPGAFVRASQDLNQATLDRSRLDAFVAALRTTEPDDVAKVAPRLATSLAIKLNPDCLQKMASLQAACLMQNQESLLLNDGHSSLLSDTITGQGADLALQLSATPQGGLGYYSPYIAAIRDIIDIFGSFHTAKYQYLPALKIERGDGISLLLNAAPSFHNPKSVLVTALPAIGPAQPPPLRLAQDAPVCAGPAATQVPMSGAPLIFSTAYAHDLRLEGTGGDGRLVSLPAVPDAQSNALAVDDPDGRLRTTPAATVKGRWGFDPFVGPSVTLQSAVSGRWRIDDDDRRALVVGRTGKVTLTGGAAACVQAVELRPASGPARPVEWKAAGPHAIALTPALADVAAGDATFLIRETGLADAQSVPVRTYAEASALAGFTLHAGDLTGTLRGTRLDQVAELSIDGVTFAAGTLTRADAGDELAMTATAPLPGATAGQTRTARVTFRDGRSGTTRATIDAARPTLAIVARSVGAPADTAPVALHLTKEDSLPGGGTLTFSLQMRPGPWRGDETVEVTSGSGATARLSVGHGLTLQDSGTAIATLDSATAFDRPAFGPLRVRVVRQGIASDWQPLATLVRKPALHQLTCAADDAVKCQLDGDALYLIQSVAADAGFTRAMPVPDGYTGTMVAVPKPADGKLYVRLRDDPATVNEIVGAKGALP